MKVRKKSSASISNRAGTTRAICPSSPAPPTIFKAVCKEKNEKKENEENQENKEINVNEIHYQFEIVRIKDVSTKREYLDIKMKVDDNDNGTISVEPSNIAQGLLSLREYGIMFSDDNSRIKLARCIEQKYQQIAVSVQTESDNKIANARFGVFLGAIGEYIRADHQSKWRTFIWWMPIPELPEGMDGE